MQQIEGSSSVKRIPPELRLGSFYLRCPEVPAALNPFGEIIQGINGRVPTPSLEAKESIRAFLYSVNKAKAYSIARVQVAA